MLVPGTVLIKSLHVACQPECSSVRLQSLQRSFVSICMDCYLPRRGILGKRKLGTGDQKHGATADVQEMRSVLQEDPEFSD